MEKIPYMLIVGKREALAQQVAVRARKEGDRGALSVSAFAAQAAEEIQQKR